MDERNAEGRAWRRSLLYPHQARRPSCALFFFSFPWGGYVVVSGDGGMSTANIPLVKMANINSRKNLGVFQCLMDPTGFHTDPMLRGPEARAQLFQPIREDLDMELELPGSQIRVAVAVTG